jgi:2-polyprenyl-6-methoxyphenol hydroxylase-like FAD-dependent oxidoreductase
MSGLLGAASLRRIGWEVEVFERSTVELVGRGAGITTRGGKAHRHRRTRTMRYIAVPRFLGV